MNYGDPLGDPQGILRGSYPKTGDPAFVRHIKIGGSGETTYPLYNINSESNRGRSRFSRILHHASGIVFTMVQIKISKVAAAISKALTRSFAMFQPTWRHR